MELSNKAPPRDFRPFVLACAERGIGKTVAYELLDADLLETFTIGRKRFVFLDSLLTLPQRLPAQGGAR